MTGETASCCYTVAVGLSLSAGWCNHLPSEPRPAKLATAQLQENWKILHRYNATSPLLVVSPSVMLRRLPSCNVREGTSSLLTLADNASLVDRTTCSQPERRLSSEFNNWREILYVDGHHCCFVQSTKYSQDT